VFKLEPNISLSLVEETSPYISLSELAPGDVIAGQFEVLAKLGSGGMSSVYRCIDLFVDRIVAVKMLFEDRVSNPKALSRFRREARAIAKLNHPNIVRLYAFNFDLSAPYIVMESVEGTTLANLIERKGPLTVEQVFRLAEQLCQALQYAHENGVIHRDLKPSNIIVEHMDESRIQVKVLDFGIAKMIDDTAPGATATGELFGTPAYMSPEQALGKMVDARTDQYSLGCVLFECLTGTPPFVGSGKLSVMMQHVQLEAPSLEETTFGCRDFPGQLQPVIAKMLAKNVDERFESMTDVYSNLITEQAKVKSDSVAVPISARTSYVNLPAQLQSDQSPSSLPFWSGLAVGASAFLLLAGACVAIYFAANIQTSTPVPVNHVDPMFSEHMLGGIDLSKVVTGGIESQLKQDRQRKELIVEDTTIADKDLSALKGARSVETLCLSGCENVKDSGLENAWHLPLKSLNIKDTGISNAAFKGISAHFPNLETLIVQQTAIDDTGVNFLTTLKHLSVVDLRFTRITSKALRTISKIGSLQSLFLDGTTVSLSELGQSELRRLSAKGLHLNESDLNSILKHKKLGQLALSRTNLSDAGLMRLASLKSLQILEILNCPNITASGIAKFRKAHPNCQVLNVDTSQIEIEKQRLLERLR
jgi:serine/threonine-protein kinase